MEPCSNRTVSYLVGALVALAFPLPVGAWEFEEHLRLGEEAYLRACNELVSRAPNLNTFACPENADARAAMARRYGQSCAIAGDFLENAEDFFATDAMTTVGTIGNFLALAVENHQHFQPHSLAKFRDLHTQAVEFAQKAASADSPSQRHAMFDRAFFFSAFADHFLQDSFVSGHMGFNRPATSAAPARLLHNIWNQHGREVANAAGEEWCAYGDGRLLPKKEDDAARCVEEWRGATTHTATQACETYSHAQFAAYHSVKAVLSALVALDEEAKTSENALWQALPVSMNSPITSVVLLLPLTEPIRITSKPPAAVERKVKRLYSVEAMREVKAESRKRCPVPEGSEDNTHADRQFALNNTMQQKARTKSMMTAVFRGLHGINVPGSNLAAQQLQMTWVLDATASGVPLGPGWMLALGHGRADAASGGLTTFGYFHRLWFTGDGALNHSFSLGVDGLWGPNPSPAFLGPASASYGVLRLGAHADYRVVAELGSALLGLSVGYGTVPGSRAHGPRFAIEIGWPLVVKGGGALLTPPGDVIN